MKFLIWLVRSLIVLLIAMFVFSSIAIDVPSLVKSVFGDVFQYSSQEAQQNVIAELAKDCSALKSGSSISISELCSNQSKMKELNQSCSDYRLMKQNNIPVQDDEKVAETCRELESGKLASQCEDKSSIRADISKIGNLCSDYSTNKIDSQEFFAGFLASPFGNQDYRTPKIKILQVYNDFIDFMNANKILYLVFISALLFIFVLLTKGAGAKHSVLMVAGICFSAGIVIMLPYILIIIYKNFVGIDTTSILGSFFVKSQVTPKSVISVLILLLLHAYNIFMLAIGTILLAIGITGKFYEFFTRKKENKPY